LKQSGLLSVTTLVIVSDHGMANAPESQVVQVKGLLSRFPSAQWEWLGATSGVRLNGAPLEGVLNALSTLSHVTCWPKKDMPKRFKFGTHRRIPDVVCLSDVGYAVSDNPDRKGPLGQHGYDPVHPDMHGILIVSGPQIPQVKLDLIENLEVYGLLAKLIGIEGKVDDKPNTLVRFLTK